jgi:hypothetical protein
MGAQTVPQVNSSSLAHPIELDILSIVNFFYLLKISFIRLLAKKGDRSTSSTRVHPLTVVQLESQLSTTRRGITRADGRVTI